MTTTTLRAPRFTQISSLAFAAFAALTGCAAGAADDGGGAIVGGKADGASLVGAYYAFDASGEVDAPQVLAIHAPTRTRRGVSIGEFDLTRDLGDYASSLTRGAYRSYAVDGVPHLRLTGEDGQVVFDAPWQLDGRELVLDPEGDAPATLRQLGAGADEQLSCITTQVLDPSVLEEGLSVHEYAFVSVGGEVGAPSLSVGGLGYDDAAVELVEEAGAVTVTATFPDGGGQHVIRVDAGPVRRGTVEVAEDGGAPVVVAHLTCY